MSTNRDGEKWNRAEHILVFNLYCKIPFGTMHMRNPRVIELARLLGRRVGSVSRKLCNFARLDPSLQCRGVEGLVHGAKGEEDIWREFARNPEGLAFESELCLASTLRKPLEEVAEVETRDLPPAGLEREAIVRLRVNQSFFRSRILSAYNFRCCVTGLAVRELLVASHIVPWSMDASNRMNPRNGLCLNALHDRAFDRLLMWIDEDFSVRFSPRIRDVAGENAAALRWLLAFEGRPLRLPKRFTPDPAFLGRHVQQCKDREKTVTA